MGMSGVTIQGRRVRIDGVRVDRAGLAHPERRPDPSVMVALIGLIVAAIAITVALVRSSRAS